MNGFMDKRLGLIIALAVSSALAFVVLPTILPSPETYLNDLSARYKLVLGSAKGARKHAPGLEYFYRTRLYGNPGVNVDRLRMDASEAMVRRESQALNKSVFTNAWTSIGPRNLAGRMKAIAFHPVNHQIVYAGAASGGVFRSTDGGANWQAVMDNAPSIPVGAIAIDKNNPDVVFAGTGEPVMDISRVRSAPSYYGVGVMKSTDAGSTWEALPWPTKSSAIFRIVLHPTSSDTMLVATRSNLMKSTTGGKTWISSALAGVCTDVRYKIGNPSIVFAAIGNDDGGMNNGIWRSGAGGDRYTWVKCATNFPSSDSTGRIILAQTPADPNLLMAFVSLKYSLVGSSGNDFLALMKSTDDGATWERVKTNLKSNYTNGQAFYDFCANISPLDKNVIFTGGLEVYRSTNGGVSFSQVTSGNEPVHVDQHVIEFQPVTNHVYIGNDGGIYKSVTNGASWDNLGYTLQTIQFYTVHVDPNEPLRILGGTQDNGTQRLARTTDWSWAIINGGDGGYCAFDPKNSNTIFSRITVYNYPFRSTNGGSSWTPLNRGFQTDLDRSNWIPPTILVGTTNPKLYTATQFVYVATNVTSPMSTPTWNAISTDLTKRNSYESVIATMTVAPSNSNVMYVGTGDGKVQKTTNLNDVEVQWEDLTRTNLPNRWITRVITDPNNENICYVGYSGTGTGHVFKTVDGGATWTDISLKAGGFPDVPVNSIAIPKNMPNVLFVATDLGVLVTTDGGTSWARFGTGLPNVVVYDLAINSANQLIAATHGRGMWITDAVVGVNSTEVAIDGDFVLEQNYPNPVIMSTHSSTAVNYAVSRPMHVTLSVFDMNGRMVQTIDRDHSQPGRYSAVISPADLPAGVYFYSMTNGTTTQTRKFAIVR